MAAELLTPKSLLIVDDSPSYCDVVERAFRVAKTGTAVFPIYDGQRAIEHLALCGRRHPMPDLVLLDRVMPGGPDGYDVLRAVRALDHLAELPILMFSGSDDEEHVTRAMEVGASGYLIKSPVQSDYHQIAREILGWWQTRQQADLLRSSCAGLIPATSQAVSTTLQSPPAMLIPASAPLTAAAVPEGPLGQMQHLLQSIFGYIASGAPVETTGLLADRKMVELTRVCREVGIDEADATGRSQDPVLVIKRGRVIRRLMSLEWADTELSRRFPQCKRTLVEQRKLWREEEKARKSCVVVARGRN